MGVIYLFVKATLENVTDLKPKPDADYFIKVKCNNCNSESEKFVAISEENVEETPGSRGTANLVYKCKFCSRVHTVNVVKKQCRAVTADDSEQFVPVCGFECRGVSLEAFEPRDTVFECKAAESSTTYTPDLSDDWVDFDDVSQASVGIYSFESKFDDSE